MDGCTEKTEELVVGEVLPKKKTISSIYSDVRAKKAARKAEKQGKDNKKRGGGKSKKDADLAFYDYLVKCGFLTSDCYDPFLREQNPYRKGDVIPEVLDLNLYSESGFHFGSKFEPNGFVGKPDHEDGHILCVGPPGSGKTAALVIPSMMTWRGCQIIVDVKGDLYRHWLRLNKHTGKKIKVFSPGSPAGCGCHYDPFAPLRHGGPEKLVGNARDLALALMPLLPSVKDPVWIQAAQNFLTGAIIYYFGLGLSFIETMLEIQISTIMDVIDEIMEDDNIEARVYISKLRETQEKVLCNIGMELSNLAALVTDLAVTDALTADEGADLLDWLELNTATEPFDVILEIPEANLERWKPMVLLMVNQLIKSLEQRPERTHKQDSELPPVLVMLDEFPRLGKILAIANGLATLRSRGVTFALFVQSLANLEDTYGRTASRVIADICSYKAVLGVTDAASQKYFSDLVGSSKSTQRTVSESHDPFSGRVTGYSRSISETREPIIYPHEFSTLKDVVLITPYGFCRVEKTLYFKNQKKFLLPQLSKNRDYTANNPLGFSYNP